MKGNNYSLLGFADVYSIYFNRFTGMYIVDLSAFGISAFPAYESCIHLTII